MSRAHALAIFQSAVHAVQPEQLLPKYIQLNNDALLLGGKLYSFKNFNSIYVIGAGKAAAAMAKETERLLDDHITGGIVVTKYGHSLPLQKIQCREAAHPLPDENGVKAGVAIAELVQAATGNDLIIALISGGASALLVDFPPGCSLKEMQDLFGLLIRSGATIQEMNIIRKHLSRIKGGQLSRLAHPATIVSFILSDVIGDPLDIIASGPTVPDPSTFLDAWSILESRDLIHQLSAGIRNWLQRGLNGEIQETPKPGDKLFDKTFNYLIGTNHIALLAAVSKAKTMGYHSFILTDALLGEASEKAVEFTRSLIQYRGPRPACLLMGGETTVTIRGSGKGGRNQEFALAALCALIAVSPEDTGMVSPLILSAGTDGTDGLTDATGAIVDKQTLQKIIDGRIEPHEYLSNNDSYHFFRQVGGHIITGPTHTNVMDIVIGLV